MFKFAVHSFFFLALCLIAATGLAQQTPSVTTAADRDHILIGEPVRLQFDIRKNAGDSLQLPAYDSFPHFQVIRRDVSPPVATAGGEAIHAEWVVTSFDSGTQTIPPLPVLVGGRTLATDSVRIEVGMPETDHLQEYHDIKDIVDLPNPQMKYVAWVFAALAVLGGMAFWLAYRREIAEEQVIPTGRTETAATAYDRAMAELDKLARQLPQSPEEVKPFYTRLTDTLRFYLAHTRYRVGPEKTSEELILLLRDQAVPADRFSAAATALRMADFVKFARYVPAPDDHAASVASIRSVIQLLNEMRS